MRRLLNIIFALACRRILRDVPKGVTPWSRPWFRYVGEPFQEFLWKSIFTNRLIVLRMMKPRVIVEVITGGCHEKLFWEGTRRKTASSVEEVIKSVKMRVFTIRSMSGKLRNEKRRDAIQRDRSPSSRSWLFVYKSIISMNEKLSSRARVVDKQQRLLRFTFCFVFVLCEYRVRGRSYM